MLIGLVLAAGPAQAAKVLRLSLNPLGAILDDGAIVQLSGGNAPLLLTGNSGVPNFGLSFTIPNDYKSDTPLILEIVWEAYETDCNFLLAPNLLYRSRPGEAADGGGASSGLIALEATTDFTLSGGRIQMAAPATEQESAKVRFEIGGDDEEFPSLDQGDGITFGIFRDDRGSEDSCTGELGISGISIVYEKGKVPKT